MFALANVKMRIRFFRSGYAFVLSVINFSLAEQASPDLKVLIKLFQKFADSKGGALVAPAGAKFLFRRFLFVSFFFAPTSPKKKRKTI